MTIQPATIQDIPLIIQLAHATWPVAYGTILKQEQLEYMLDIFYTQAALEQQMNAGERFILAWAEQQVTGFASYSPTAPGICKLHKIYVHPSAQQSGTGSRLLQAVTAEARAMGAALLQLNVNRANPAHLFYEKKGFRVVQEADIAIGKGFFMNDYILELPL